MGIQFQDDFNRTNGAIGNGWASPLGTVDILSNQARLHTNSCQISRAVPTPTATDLSVAFTQGAGWSYAANRTFYVRLRADAPGTTYYQWMVQLGALGTATVVVSKVIAAAMTILTQHYQFAVTSGAHIFTFDCQGSNLRFLVDGTLVVAVVDSGIASGGYLFTGQAGTLDTIFWDDITIFDFNASSMYVSPSTILPGVAGQSLTLYGLGTAWTAGVPGTPTFTATDGTITYQHVINATTATLTYTPPSYAATVMFTDPSTGHIAYLAVESVPTPVPPGGIPGGLSAALHDLSQAIAVLLDPMYLAIVDGLTLAVGESVIGYLRTLGTPPGTDTFESQIAELLRQLNVDDTSPATVRHLLAGTIAGVTDILADMLALTGEGAHSLSDVLTAITALGSTALGEDDLDTVENNIMGSGVFSITAIKEYLDALSGDETVTLPILGIAIGLLPSAVDLANAVTTLEGASSKTITDAYNKAWDAANDANAAVTAVGLLAVADGAAFIAQTAERVAQTAAIDVSLGVAVGEIDASIVGAVADIAADIAGVAGDIASVSGNLAEANADLDELITAIGALKTGAPCWPGASHVTTGTPVAVSGDQRVTAAMDGCLLNLTTIPSRNVYWTADGLVNVERAGFIVFCGDNGYADERQPIAWSQGIYTPKRLLTAASVVVHLTGLASGTLTPWLRT